MGLGGRGSHWFPTIGTYTLASTDLAIFLKSHFLKSFSNIAMPQIKWGNRYMNTNHSVCLVTIDGTDFCLREPTEFDPRWFSHKFKGPGFRYEVGVCIQTGWIVWINGPYAPGDWSDLAIARYGIATKLDPGEKYLADGGYSSQDGNAKTPTGLHNHDQSMKSKARARHEAINALLKQYAVLKDCFRHSRNDHPLVFKAVANLVQAKIMLEGATYQVAYNDRA